MFQWQTALPPPCPDGSGKIVLNIAPKSRNPGHGKISAQRRRQGKHEKQPGRDMIRRFLFDYRDCPQISQINAEDFAVLKSAQSA